LKAYYKKNYPDLLVDIDYQYNPRVGPRVVNEGVRVVAGTPSNEPLPPTAIVRYAGANDQTARIMVQRGLFNRPAINQLLNNPEVDLTAEDREFLERARELMNGRIQTYNVNLQTTRQTNYNHLQRGILRFIASKAWTDNPDDEYSLKLIYRDPEAPAVTRVKTVTGRITQYRLTLNRFIEFVSSPQFVELVSKPLAEAYGTDIESTGYMVDPTTFTISRISIGTGGEAKSNAYRTVRFSYCTARSYTGRNGDCLLMCIKKHLNLKGTTNQMRKALADLLPEGPISTRSISILEDFYELNIDVYVEGDVEYEVIETRDLPQATNPSQCETVVRTLYPMGYIRQTNRYPTTLEVFLTDNHYHHISKLLPQGKLCRHCGRDNCHNIDDCRRYLLAQNRIQKVDHRNPKKLRTRIDIALGLSREIYSGDLEPLIFTLAGYQDTQIHYGCDAGAALVDAMCLRKYDGDIIVANCYGGADMGWYAVLKELIRRQRTPPNSNMFIADGRILQLRFDNICCWDLNQFIPKPLSRLAEELTGKALPQCPRYQKGAVLTQAQIESLRQTVLAEVDFLGDLTDRFCDIVKSLTNLDATTYPTMASMAYNLWKKGLPQGVYLPPADDRTDTFIRKAMVGGRVQCMHGTGHINKDLIGDSLCLVDCNSLYPYVMESMEYPAGDEHWTDKEIPGALAIYRCKVNQDNLPDSHKILPVRNANGLLDWKPKGTHELVITSVDLELLRQYLCEVTVIDGVYWPNRGRPFKEYLEMFQQAKESAAVKDTVDDKITVMICKLMMNLLTGKLVQKKFERSWCLARSADDLTRFQRQHFNISVDEIKVPEGAGMVLKLEGVKKYQYNPKTATLVQLGTFIYSYARRYMYETVYVPTHTFYTDTDSALIPTSQLELLPIGPKFGQFKIEMSDIVQGYLVGAKCYYLRDDINNVRMRFKGVDTHCEWYPDPEPSSEAEVITTYQGLNEDMYIRLLSGQNINCICLRLSHNLSGDENTEVATVKEVYVTQKFGKGGQLISPEGPDDLNDGASEDWFGPDDE
jgi:hypothetical protein